MKTKGNVVNYLIALIYLMIVVVIITGKLTSDKDEVKNPEFLSKEYIWGNYLFDERFSDVLVFPLAISSEDESFYYVDSYGAGRTYGGERIHEGCDIMTPDNIRGRYPVLSVCDGVVENMGWLELGGYRIGIRSDNNVYYYYAHLFSYAENLKEGDTVRAGQIIGFAGDTGYSKVEGTVGNFDVHLHFGIYLYDENGKEHAINPYPLLQRLEKRKLIFSF